MTKICSLTALKRQLH